MSPSYVRHFALLDAPFGKDLDDHALWLPPSKVCLRDAIVEALAARESVMLVGEPGVGKTCLLRALRATLPQEGFRLTYCHNATLGRRDFYRQLCTALGLAPSATAAALFHAVSTHVTELGREKTALTVAVSTTSGNSVARQGSAGNEATNPTHPSQEALQVPDHRPARTAATPPA